jgi:dihydroorotate dehydrogenase (NAD+) catalytic subunit
LNLSVQIAPNLKLKNPLMTAAGTFGYGTELIEWLDIQKLGAIVTKSITLEPREGNSQPRLAETAAGLLNSIGLQNIGVEALIKEKALLWAGWQVPVIVSLAGEFLDDYFKLASRLDKVPGVSGIEVNISCPNLGNRGIEFALNPESAAEVTRAVGEATSLPLIVKLSPNVTDIVGIATAVAEAGAQAVVLINTLRGMAIDIAQRKPFLGDISGGLSGPAIKPVALYMVYQTAKVLKIPVIGCGGITTAADALEFLMAGASAVQIGTANFFNPSSFVEILSGIEQFMEREGFKEIGEIIGIAQAN